MAKRFFDIAISLLALLLFSFVIVAIAIAIRLTMGPPVLFTQIRPGQGGRPFKILKFRTMSDHRDGNEKLLPDAERLSRFGRLLRASSLDELPELLNVVRGEMSLVGPRPLLMQYIDRYSPEQARRHEVRPGLTGWAQINGRNAISWEEKFQLDTWYVDNRNFWLDMQILGITAWRVLHRKGITAPGEATMPEFMGNASNAIKQASSD